MNTTIKVIRKEEAWHLRHKVMWPDQEFDFIKLKDDDVGIHYGHFKGDVLISVVSLFITNAEAQFRKFATLQDEQGKGYGSTLLNFVIGEANNRGLEKIWCNARKEKANFYRRFGLQETDVEFVKKGKEYVVMELFFPKKEND